MPLKSLGADGNSNNRVGGTVPVAAMNAGASGLHMPALQSLRGSTAVLCGISGNMDSGYIWILDTERAAQKSEKSGETVHAGIY